MTYTIGFPSLQENGEYEHPLIVNGVLVAFFDSYHRADLAGANLDAVADIQAGNTDTCLTCDDQTEDVICETCVEDGARCSEGHALGDYGECGECGECEEAIATFLRCSVCGKLTLAPLNENDRCPACEETSQWIKQMRAAGKCPACQEEGHEIQECPALTAYDVGFLIRVPRAAVRA
jgi:hypothetical protein